MPNSNYVLLRYTFQTFTNTSCQTELYLNEFELLLETVVILTKTYFALSFLLLRRRKRRRPLHQLKTPEMLMTWYVFLVIPCLDFKYLTRVSQTDVKAISCVFAGCAAARACLMMCLAY